jgi:hypothetical protein
MIQSNDILLISQYFQQQLQEKCIKSTEYHNHPPVNFLVNSCDYCKKFGNEFNNTKHI